jgi:HD-like signal output (HDOD) protein
MMTTREQISIETRINSFPALPLIVTKVLAVTADPESSAEDLMEVILPDQSMCTAILKVANSAFFGIPREVSTMERALMVLGFEEVRNIVIGKALFAAFPKLGREFRESVTLFWQHAFTCGLAAKIMGEKTKISPSELFVAGLIHDIGKLAMLTLFGDKYPLLRELAEPEGSDSGSEELCEFKISHDRVGLLLADRWLLPKKLAMAIGYHHYPEKAPSHRQYPILIQTADILSLMYCSPDFIGAEDAMKIFNDFLPETRILWSENDLDWDINNIGTWYTTLSERFEQDQAILDIFTSS